VRTAVAEHPRWARAQEPLGLRTRSLFYRSVGKLAAACFLTSEQEEGPY